ncbi:MAG: hypothetical protein A4E26_01086 [Methanobacterium sp. PtaU1.Bin097]|nr:MAG: hypothetical protein A4E26_01086 [Methanobacterium sp. PtaU1.Bin097]
MDKYRCRACEYVYDPKKENQKPVQSQEYPLRIWITSGSVPDVNLEKTSSKNTFKYL